MQTAVQDASNEEKQSTAVLRWLFDSDDFCDTIILLGKNGCLWILVYRGMAAFVQSFVNQLEPNFRSVVILKHDNIDQDGLIRNQLWQMAKLEHHKIGIFFEDFVGDEEGIRGGLQRKLIIQEENKLIELVDIELGVATVMAVKDEDEVNKVRLAGKFLKTVLQRGFYDVLKNDLKVRKATRDKSDWEALLRNVIENPTIIDPLSGKRVLSDSDLPDSDHSYKVCLKPEILPLRKYDRNAVVVSVGTSCDNYYSETTRTYLFNPPAIMKDTYQVLLGMKEVCVASLVPGNPMKNVYQSAMSYLSCTRGFEYLQETVPENLGSVVGLNHLVFSLNLDRINETKLERNMVLSLRIGFGNLPLPVSLKSTIYENLFSNELILFRDSVTEIK